MVGNLFLATIPDQNRTIENKYDLRNRLYLTTEKADGLEAHEIYGFDCVGNRTSFTDRFGQITVYDFDDFNRIKKITYPKVCDEEGKEIEPTASYTYDIFDNILTDTDAKGYVTVKNYTIRGKPSKIFYPDGTKELFKYDPEGSLHRSCTRDDRVTIHEYDYQGRISYQETLKALGKDDFAFLRGHSYEYNAFRLLHEKEKLLGDLELYIGFHHDPAGRIIKKVLYDSGDSEDDPSSRIFEFTHDSLGRIEKEKIWFGAGPKDYFYKVYQYDLLGQLKEEKIQDVKDRILLQRMFEYDRDGNCIEEYSFLNGQKISLYKTQYDAFGEPISFTNALGNTTVVSVDYIGKTLRKTLTDPLSSHTELEFDALGRLVSSVKHDSQGTLLASQQFGYDAIGNKCVETNDVIFEGSSLGSQVSRWVYGPMARLEQQIDAADSTEEIRTSFTYDHCGRLKTKTHSGISEPITYSYDPTNGWLSKIEHKSKGKNVLNSYEYYASGNLRFSETHDGIIVAREYNVFGDVTRETIRHDDGYYDSEVSYKYDRLGRPTKITLPDRSHINYTYDEVFGRRIERTSSTNRVYFQHEFDHYDSQGKLTKETSPIGSISWEYDQGGRKTGQTSDYFSESVPELGYNRLNCLLEIDRKGSFPVQKGLYFYDLLGQLSSENVPHRTYAHDSLGNCRSFNYENLNYNNLNQLKQISTKQYFFDAQGNLSKKFAWAVLKNSI